MTRSTCRILCAEADRDRLQPILDMLRSKGLKISGPAEKPGSRETVLAALSESFYEDSALCESLLGLIGAGAENVLPLQLDSAPISDMLKNALYSRNIIPAAERDDALIAERIFAAMPKKKNRLPLLLSAAGVVLLAVIALLIVRAVRIRTPVVEEAPIVIPPSVGLTEEDLALIKDVVIVGDQFAFFTDEDCLETGYWPGYEIFTTLDEWNDVHWYSNENGQELGMVRHNDLRFLSLMPNLRYLALVLVETDGGMLPDLSNASQLEGVSILSCNIDQLGWLSGSAVETLSVRFTPVIDFTVLTGCEHLKDLMIDMYGTEVETDFSSFSPPALETLWLWHANPSSSLDLSGLRSCPRLNRVTFGDLPLRDLACLDTSYQLSSLTLHEMNDLTALYGIEGLSLNELRIANCLTLRDISAVAQLHSLKMIVMQSCPELSDLSPVAGCQELEYFHVWGMYQIGDLSFLSSLRSLCYLEIFDVDLSDLDFLEAFADRKSFVLGFSGDIRDYSGLSYIRDYEALHLNVRSRYNQNGNLSQVLPYLEGVTVGSLHLHDCTRIDLSQLPEVRDNLEIWYGDLQDLQDMPALGIRQLTLYDCPNLSSLEGIRNLRKASAHGELELRVVGCPRLNDWSAIENLSLAHLTLDNVYSLPVFDDIGFGSLDLNSIESLWDLHVLDRLSTSHRYNFIDLTGLENLQDLSSLRRLEIGHLTVPPQVADQAEELREEGVVQNCEVAYPEGSWQPYEGAMELLSLDELDTLPKSLLQRIEKLCIAGGRIYAVDRYDILEDWENLDENGLPALLLSDCETGETEVLPAGSGTITDLSVFSELTGLRELKLYAQPLQDLNGIQNLFGLEHLEACFCPKLTDVSAAFTLQQLGTLILKGCPVESIQGIQNLFELRLLDIRSTKIADLSPLDALNTEGLDVWISSDMQPAIANQEGTEYSYTLETNP